MDEKILLTANEIKTYLETLWNGLIKTQPLFRIKQKDDDNNYFCIVNGETKKFNIDTGVIE